MNTILVNTGPRPVELHLGGGTLVVAPRGRFPCGAEDLRLGQVQALLRDGVLHALSEVPPLSEADAPPPARRGGTRRRKPRPEPSGTPEQQS